MSWGWIEGGTHKTPRKLGGFASQEAAKDNAIYNASLKHVDDVGMRDLLWNSLERAGWVIQWQDSWS